MMSGKGVDDDKGKRIKNKPPSKKSSQGDEKQGNSQSVPSASPNSRSNVIADMSHPPIGLVLPSAQESVAQEAQKSNLERKFDAQSAKVEVVLASMQDFLTKFGSKEGNLGQKQIASGSGSGNNQPLEADYAEDDEEDQYDFEFMENDHEDEDNDQEDTNDQEQQASSVLDSFSPPASQFIPSSLNKDVWDYVTKLSEKFPEEEWKKFSMGSLFKKWTGHPEAVAFTPPKPDPGLVALYYQDQKDLEKQLITAQKATKKFVKKEIPT